MKYEIELDGKQVKVIVLAIYAHYPSPATAKIRLENGEIKIIKQSELKEVK